ncbi:MAG: alanine--tRNA ligase, partial [Planctomycetota bacterium]
RGLALFQLYATSAQTEADKEWQALAIKTGEIRRIGDETQIHAPSPGEKSAAEQIVPMIRAEDAFKLYDTYGFPLDLTVQMADERGMTVDETGFDKLMEQAKAKARASAKQHVEIAIEGELPATDDKYKYKGRTAEAKVVGWITGNTLVDTGRLSKDNNETALVLDRTCFYAEQGGQVGDRGVIRTDTGAFAVTATQLLGDGVLHIGNVTEGEIIPGQKAALEVDAGRDLTRKNHTATHVCHWALRTVLGEHVKQHGSVVEPERLRFDFDHNAPVTVDEIADVERLVNEKICADLEVKTQELPAEEAKKIPGVRAFFGEKYGDVVRVVSIGDAGFSVEFCGGTHLSRTGEIGLFKIISEEAVAKGVRRITAVTGPRAVQAVQQIEQTARRAAGMLNTGIEDLPERVAGLQDEIKKLRKQLQKGAAADIKGVRQKLLDGAEKIGGTAVIVGEMPDVPVEQIREAADWLRTEAGSAAACLAANAGGKPLLIAAMTKDLIKKGLKSGDLIKHIVPAIDGRGGGKPDLAQAGGKKVEGIAEALALAREWIKEKLGK